MATVAILGCGYVGRALGRELVDGGHEVAGICRSDAGLDAVEAAGLRPVSGDVTDPDSLADVPDADALVFASSSGGGGAEAARAVYVEGLRTAIDAFAGREDPPDRLLYTSSTGVYGDHGGDWVDEGSELRAGTSKTEALVEAEVAARSAADAGMTPVVARLAGIYGPDRYRLERYLEGPVRPGWLNQVHVADVAGALRFLLEHEAPPETVLVADDEPAWRPDFAAWLAEACGREPPALADAEGRSTERRRRGEKRCSNDRLRGLGYELRYPTYREGYRAAVEHDENEGAG